jgi:hypothetical protein
MFRVVLTYRANRVRDLAAQTARQARITWATYALARQEFDPATTARNLTVLVAAGVPQADAERTIHAALAAAASAYRVTMATLASEVASDSENTDTGRMASVRR